jgi:hypothetical protein
MRDLALYEPFIKYGTADACGSAVDHVTARRIAITLPAPGKSQTSCAA